MEAEERPRRITSGSSDLRSGPSARDVVQFRGQGTSMELKVAKILWGLAVVLGMLLTALGLLWALQGADLVHIEPIACVANCAPVEGFSATWLAAGIAAVIVGLAIAWKSVSRFKRATRSSRPQV